MLEVSIGLLIAISLPIIIGVYISIATLIERDVEKASLREEYKKIGD